MPLLIHGSGGGGGGTWDKVKDKPDILNCMRMYGGTNLDSKATTIDVKAQYPTISIPTDTAHTTVFSKRISDLPYGKYSVMIRMKISNKSSSADVLQIISGDTTVLTTFYLKPNAFDTANEYQTFGFIIDHKQDDFQVSLNINTALTGVTLNIDYMSISPAFTSISAIA